MAKAKKASQKKPQQTNNRGVRIASLLFVAIGLLVVLSMIASSVFTTNQPVVAPSFPTNIPTTAP